MTIGERIKYQRKRKKVSQEELAKRIGLKHSVISKYENNQITPGVEQVLRIAEALEIPNYELFYDSFYEDEENHGSFRIDLTDHVRQGIISDYFEMLNDAGKDVATDVLEGLTMIPKYQKEQKEPPQTEEPAEAE